MRLLAVCCAMLLSSSSFAAEVAGVKLEETTTLGDATLVLNGAGLRKKLFFKVYVGALFVVKKSDDAEALVAADAPRLVRLHMLRAVDRGTIMKAFREGIERNSKATAAAALAKLAQVEAAIPEELKPGQVVTVAYQPGVGTALGVEGRAAATVEGKDFADAILRVWLGSEPVDAALKAGMLGR